MTREEESDLIGMREAIERVLDFAFAEDNDEDETKKLDFTIGALLGMRASILA
jgi:hypothetical protein